MRIKHYYAFGNDVAKKMKSDGICSNQVDWELLRKEGGSFFSIDESREEFIKNAERSDAYLINVDAVSEVLKERSRVCALGCGKGIFEFLLKRSRPDLYICCSDYTSEALNKLKTVFFECDEYKTFDMKTSYDEMKQYDCLVMHRISTEFTHKEWRDRFRKCMESDIKQIIFIPTEILKVTDVLRELLLCVRWTVKKEKLTFSGWMYSKNEFKKMWIDYYNSTFINKDGACLFYLQFCD